MFRCLALLVGVSACNVMLGLDEPERVASVVDDDEDGIDDSRDNCLEMANPAQEDTDGDRRGDACDSCPTSRPTRDLDNDGVDDACDSCVLGAQVDDDGDGVMDACDLCPVTPTRMQLDTDGDLVGDECDGESVGNGNERLRFDSFTSLDPAFVGSSMWALGSAGSSVTPIGIGETTLGVAIEDASAVSAMFEFPADAVVGVSGLYPGQRCELRCVQGACVLHAEDAGRIQASAPVNLTRGTLHLIVELPMLELPEMRCALHTESATIAFALRAFGGRSFAVYATAGSRVLGVDIVK